MIRVVSQSAGSLPAIPRREARWNPALDAALVQVQGRDALLDRLHKPGALVVTTGQQPGLFTGPLYAIHKALAAASLARTLERTWKSPVVPVFWIAGDDHDFVEASGATWTDSTGALIDWRLPERSATAPPRSMAREALPASIVQGLSLLESSLPAGEARDDTLAWLRRHYVAGNTVHAACAGALAELLAPYGILCLDATHPAFKRAQVPWLALALEKALPLDAALAALPASKSGIVAGSGETLVFRETAAGRDRLVVDGDGFRSRRSREHLDHPRISQLLASEPEAFSANVLLRPVVESALIPTVAYVAGPGEYRYLTEQAAVLYPLLGVSPQLPVHRWSGTLIEPWSERLLQRLDLTAQAVLDDDGTLARSILRRDMPPEAAEGIATLVRDIERGLETVSTAGKAIDAVLERAIEGRRKRLLQVTDDLERLLERHLRRRTDIAHAQFQRLANGLRPRGQPQERVFTAATFLGRYGREWLQVISAATDTWAG